MRISPLLGDQNDAIFKMMSKFFNQKCQYMLYLWLLYLFISKIYYWKEVIKLIIFHTRYRDDVIREGQVGGYCKLNKKLLKQQGQHKSPLQSW